MDLGFLHNPVNTVITAVTLLLIIGGVLYFLSKRRVSFGKDGIIVSDTAHKAAYSIPMIDRKYQSSMNSAMLEAKPAIYGILMEGTPDKVQQSFIMWKIFETIRTRIYENHLTLRFSDNEMLENWYDECTHETILKLRYIEQYTGLDIDLDNAVKVIKDVFRYAHKLCIPFVEDMVTEKLKWYRDQTQTEQIKSLIDKNERYLKGFREVYMKGKSMAA
jgi:hypothetical protein